MSQDSITIVKFEFMTDIQIYDIYKFVALKGNWEIPPA